MGGETAVGGNEVVVVMQKEATEGGAKRAYRLLATSRTATMQKEMQQLGDQGQPGGGAHWRAVRVQGSDGVRVPAWQDTRWR